MIHLDHQSNLLILLLKGVHVSPASQRFFKAFFETNETSRRITRRRWKKRKKSCISISIDGKLASGKEITND